MKTTRLVLAVAALAAALALSGCPQLRVGQVRLAAPPKGGKTTLIVDVETRLEVKPEDEQPPRDHTGAGVVAFWLPPGWKVAEARMRVPAAGEAETLSLVPDLAPAFPTTFPHREGEWWTFLTGELRISAGMATFPVEVDLEGPAQARELVLGIAVGAVDNCQVSLGTGWEPGDSLPTEVRIDLRKGEVAVRERHAPGEVLLPGCVKKEDEPQKEDELGLEEEGEMPIDTICPECVCPDCPPQVGRGPRGCSCRSPGGATAESGLVRLLLNLFSI